MYDFLINTKTIHPFSQDGLSLIRQQGNLKVIDLELIKIKNLKVETQQIDLFNQQINADKGLNWVIVSSINSLIHCPKIILDKLQLHQTAVATVGKVSGDYARKVGLNLKFISQSSNVKGLMDIDEIINAQSFLFLKGRQGNETLIDYLKAQKKSVLVMEVYQRKEIALSQQIIDDLIAKTTLWVFYSQSALISAYNNFKNAKTKNNTQLDWLVNQDIICYSNAIAKRANQLGFKGKIEAVKLADHYFINQKIMKLNQMKLNQC